MKDALVTQLRLLKMSKIRPNFSELARQYDLDRRTIKKYYDGYEGKPEHHNKPSKLDEHYDLIKLKLSLRGANIRAVYEYLIDCIWRKPTAGFAEQNGSDAFLSGQILGETLCRERLFT